MSEGVTEYIILDIIDDMEEAIFNAEKHEMTQILDDLNSIHGKMQDMGNAENIQDKAEQLNTAIAQPLKVLVEACQAGERLKAEKSIGVMKEKMAAL